MVALALPVAPPAAPRVVVRRDRMFSAEAHAALSELAGRFRGDGPVAADWRRRSAKRPDAFPLATRGRSEFGAHLPRILAGLADRLTGGVARRRDVPAVGLTRDWRRFRAAALGELNDFVAARPNFPAAAARHARAALSKYVFDGLDRAAEHHEILLRQESDRRADALSDTVRRQARAVGERGEQLREAAHDLRGGLGVVRTAMEILEDPAVDAGTRGEMVAAARVAADEVARMVADLLSAGRLESGLEVAAPEEFDLGRLLAGLCVLNAPVAGAGQATLAADGPDSLPARTDPVMVRRVVQNLALNAIKYGGPGVAVKVAWRAVPRAFGNRDGWRVEVTDDGPGLPPAIAAAFGDALEGAPAAASDGGATARGGEGIGLSIVRRLCGELGATLRCRTGRDGTAFTVLFPHLPADP